MNSRTKLSFSLLVILLFRSCNSSSDTITTSKPVRDGETIESNGKIFALGFFSPRSSKNRYVGIWYAQVSQQTVIWVANRESPISDRSGSVEINNHGNILINRNNGTVPIWSSNVSENGKSSSVAQLLDSGNLRLFDNVTGRVLWQSFDHPTDCILPSMKLGLTRKDGLNRFLTNWKSPEDPGLGDYSFRINPSGFPQVFFYKGLNPRWRVGSWTGKALSGIPEMRPNYIFSVAFVDNKDEVSTTYTVSDTSLLVNQVINETGIHLRFMSTPKDKAWNGYWSAPKEKCDNYSQCGLNGYCSMVGLDNAATSKCTCLPGFEPKSPRQWSSGDGSGGCLRKRGLACHEGEGFAKLEGVKVPDTSEAQVDMDIGLTACREKCLGNCSCVAYSNAYFESDNGGIGCLLWHGDLLDMRTYAGAGQDFFVRVNAAEMARLNKDASAGKRRTAVIAVACVAAALLVAALVVWIIRRKRRRESQRLDNLPLAFASSGPFFDDSLHGENRENTDLPFLPLSTVAEATSNFSSDNKLGHGGFGSVYKGVLPNGMEIAVKRLSKHSGQGIEEFKTEIVLIAKLQHRNLVKILGCCTEGEEKMLIYEYLPNRSLDSFIFVCCIQISINVTIYLSILIRILRPDKEKKLQMDWTRRFEIICGIARGIMYLHEDSRLRIIHRDLKASNILLDAVMIPKISDFGMARIFNRDQIEGSTDRVVGTYGYMSPEYAMDGQFSIKSDVYSFGVLLLEIITGRRNSGFYHESPASNLIGHVWELWGEDKAEEIIDKAICETGGAGEILRCMQIGLLCVQESASDRPTMSSVVFMLGNVSIEVPYPKRPAFIVRRKVEDNASLVWSNEPACSSGVDLSITEIHAR